MGKVKMKTDDMINLPVRTDRTKEGPKFNFEFPVLFIDYDYEEDDGSLIWVRIKFLNVLAYQFRQEPCCISEDIDANNVILKLIESRWLNEMRQRRSVYFGSQGSKSDEGLYAHWKIFFDNIGCLDVIAGGYEIV